MATEMTYFTGNETLSVERCWCGCLHAVPKSLRDAQRRDFDDGKRPMSIFCPLGHQWVPTGKTRSDRLEAELQRERARLDQVREELKHTEHSRRAEKAAKTRMKNRIAVGVCPCCNRTFQDLQRHMKSKHPEFAANDTQ